MSQRRVLQSVCLPLERGTTKHVTEPCSTVCMLTSGERVHCALQDLEIVPQQLPLGNRVAVPKMAAGKCVEIVTGIRSAVHSAEYSSRCDR
jgi:hypothetical protein